MPIHKREFARSDNYTFRIKINCNSIIIMRTLMSCISITISIMHSYINCIRSLCLIWKWFHNNDYIVQNNIITAKDCNEINIQSLYEYFVHANIMRNMISIYPWLLKLLCWNIEESTGNCGKTGKSSSSCIFYLGMGNARSYHLTRPFCVIFFYMNKYFLLENYLISVEMELKSTKLFDFKSKENYNETNHRPRWVAHACSTLSNLDRYSHKIILY